MNNNEIYIIEGTDYTAMTEKLLQEVNLRERIPSVDARIGIKPNLVSAAPASQGGTTHPEVVAGIIRYLQREGFYNLVMMEGSWVGDRTEDAVRVCGYDRLSQEYGVPFFDTQKDGSHKVQVQDLSLKICDCVEKVDFLINVPVLKGHCQTKMTCALKNMKGLIPNSEKRHFHSLGLHKPIAYLNTVIHQDFIVVDHICGDWDFEDGGNPVVTNRVMAAADPVLCDEYGCEILGRDVEDVPYIGLARSLGVGNANGQQFHIHWCGGQGQEIARTAHNKVVEVSDKVKEVESCSACYGYLIPMLSRLKDEGLLDKLQEKICIGQGYRGQTGVLGIGNCTKHFTCSLKGCPPMPDEIYDFLKKYIENQEKSK